MSLFTFMRQAGGGYLDAMSLINNITTAAAKIIKRIKLSSRESQVQTDQDNHKTNVTSVKSEGNVDGIREEMPLLPLDLVIPDCNIAAKKCKSERTPLESHVAEDWKQLVVNSLRCLCQEEPDKLLECVTDGSLDDGKMLKMIAEDGPFGQCVSREDATMDEIIISLMRHHSRCFKKDARCWRYKSTTRRACRLPHMSLQALLDLGDIKLSAQRDAQGLNQLSTANGKDIVKNTGLRMPTSPGYGCVLPGVQFSERRPSNISKLPLMECRNEDDKTHVLPFDCACEACQLKYSEFALRNQNLTSNVNRKGSVDEPSRIKKPYPPYNSASGLLTSSGVGLQSTGDVAMQDVRRASSNPELTQHEAAANTIQAPGYRPQRSETEFNVLEKILPNVPDNVPSDENRSIHIHRVMTTLSDHTHARLMQDDTGRTPRGTLNDHTVISDDLDESNIYC